MMDGKMRRLRAAARRLAHGKHPSQVRYPTRFVGPPWRSLGCAWGLAGRSKQSDWFITYNYACLPDTMDPREPKRR